MSWLRLFMVGALIAAATSVQLADAPAARAGVSAFTYTADSPNNSDAVKTAVARCPAGTRVYGGGATVFNDQSRVVLATMLPFHGGSGDGYSVAATERPGGHSGSWYVRAFATCGAQLSGMELIVASGFDGAVAACTGSKVVVGTGGALGDTDKGISFSEVFVPSDHRRVVVNGHRFTSSAPQQFPAFAAAVCAPAPDGYVVRNRTITGYGVLTNVVTCDEVALGAGMSVQTSSSPNSFVDMMDTHNNIVRDRVHQTNQSFTALVVQAVCADF